MTRWLIVSAQLTNSPFLQACRAQRPAHTPVWFMRQAGRSLPEYRKVREGIAMLDSCMRPDLVTEITLQPVRRYGVDAAIFFSDIVLPLKAIGVDLDIVPGVGPVVADPIRSSEQLAQLRPLDAADVPYISEAVQLLVAELGPTPLIGFAGAPFTLASYLIEGGPSRNLERTKALMWSDPKAWHDLMSRLAQIALAHLRVQVEAGASAIQLFDSWVGSLTEPDYRVHVMPHSRHILEGLADLGVPRIHFGVNTGELLPAMHEAGADVIGVDFRISLTQAAERIGKATPVQGNLDPAVVFSSPDVVSAAVRSVLDSARGLPGHVFNLGHGVLPTSDPGVLASIVEQVHRETS